MCSLTAPPTRQKQNISPVLVYTNSNCRTMMCLQLLLSFAAIRIRHVFQAKKTQPGHDALIL